MTFFDQILMRNNLNHHDGRALWKYNITENEFRNICTYFTTLERLPNLNRSKDLLLLFAYYWHNIYDGISTNTKENFFRSVLPNTNLDYDDLYRFSKEGLQLLNIPIIRKQNRLFFVTMLMQGGAPVNFFRNALKNPEHIYIRLLTTIIQENITSIAELDNLKHKDIFRPFFEIIERSDSFCECLIEIANDQDIFDDVFNSIENDTVKSIFIELKKHIRSNTKENIFKNTFFINDAINPKVKCEINLQKHIGISDFEELKECTSLNILLNEKDIGSYRLNANGNILLNDIPNYIIENSTLKESNTIELKYGDNTFRTFNFNSLNLDKLKFFRKSGNRFVYSQSLESTNGVLAISTQNFKTLNEAVINFNQGYYFYEITESVDLIQNDLEYFFNIKNIDFELLGQKDTRISNQEKKAVFTEWPTIETVTDNPNTNIYFKKGNSWVEQNDFERKEGLITGKIVVGNTEQLFKFVYVKEDTLKVSCNQFNPTIVNVNTADSINVQFYNKQIEIIEETNNFYKIELQDIQKEELDFDIKLTFKDNKQSVKLALKTPFEGIYLVDIRTNKHVNNFNDICFNRNSFLNYKLFIRSNDKIYTLKLSLSFNNKLNFKTDKYVINFADLLPFFNSLVGKVNIMHNDFKNESFRITFNNFDFIIIRLFSNFIDIKEEAEEEDRVYFELANPLIEETKLIAVPLISSYNEVLKEDNSILQSFELHQNERGCFLSNINEIFRTYRFNLFLIIEKGIEQKNKVRPSFIRMFADDRYNNNQYLLNLYQSTHDLMSSLNIEESPQNQVKEFWDIILFYTQICIENNLHFQTFNQLKVIAFNRELLAKFYVVCSDKLSNINFEKFERDFGIKFEWLSKEHYIDALEWYNSSFISIINERADVLHDNLCSTPDSNEKVNIIGELTNLEQLKEQFIERNYNSLVVYDTLNLYETNKGIGEEALLSKIGILMDNIKYKEHIFVRFNVDNQLINPIIANTRNSNVYNINHPIQILSFIKTNQKSKYFPIWLDDFDENLNYLEAPEKYFNNIERMEKNRRTLFDFYNLINTNNPTELKQLINYYTA